MIIEIWSDIACPYCYIGKRKLEQALDQFSEKDKIKLVWHSYELNPSLPKEALKISMQEYYAEHLGMSASEAAENLAKMTALAKEVGLDYDMKNLVVANTSDALRLVKYANLSDRATEAEELLFKAYFVEGKDISNRSMLLDIAASLDMKAKSVETMLDSDRFLSNIQKDMEYSEQELKLEYIPFYRLNNKQIIQGSIDVADYLTVLKRAFADWESGTQSDGDDEVITGMSCSVDGVCS